MASKHSFSVAAAVLVVVVAALVWAGLHRLGTAILSSELSHVAVNGTPAEVVRLVRQGADPNSSESEGVPPLSLAVLNDRFEVAQTLLRLGADPNQSDPDGYTPTQYAGNSKMLRLLIAFGGRSQLRPENLGR